MAEIEFCQLFCLYFKIIIRLTYLVMIEMTHEKVLFNKTTTVKLATDWVSIRLSSIIQRRFSKSLLSFILKVSLHQPQFASNSSNITCQSSAGQKLHKKAYLWEKFTVQDICSISISQINELSMFWVQRHSHHKIDYTYGKHCVGPVY